MFWKSRKTAEVAVADAPDELTARVRVLIDEFRPFILADGGDIELIGVDAGGTVRVRLKGACVGCPSSFMTLQMGLEQRLKERISEIKCVLSV